MKGKIADKKQKVQELQDSLAAFQIEIAKESVNSKNGKQFPPKVVHCPRC
jgi:hypothetical protein